MKIDGRQILEKLGPDKRDRKKVSLYLSESLYTNFKKKCKNVPASQVMEELMREFIKSLE